MPAPGSQFYLPEFIHRDDLIVDSDTDSFVSQPQPGAGYVLDAALDRGGQLVERMLSSLAERCGMGPNALMQRLLHVIDGSRRRPHLFKRPRREDVLSGFVRLQAAGMM